MQNNFNPPLAHNVPPNAPKQGHYVIDPDQLPLFDIPPQKPQNSPFQAIYGPNQHRVIIRKATKFIKKSQNHENDIH